MFSVKVGNDQLSGSHKSLQLRGATKCSLSSALHSASVDEVQAKWNATEEKPAVVAIGLSSFVAIWAAAGLVDAVNKLPLIGGLLEGVGLVVSGWFIYRNLIFGPDRSVPVTCAASCSRCRKYSSVELCSRCSYDTGSCHVTMRSYCRCSRMQACCTSLYFRAASLRLELAQHPQILKQRIAQEIPDLSTCYSCALMLQCAGPQNSTSES